MARKDAKLHLNSVYGRMVYHDTDSIKEDADNMNALECVKIARLVLELRDNGVPTYVLLAALASAIDMLINKDNLNHKETWHDVYTKSQIVHELLS